MDNSPAAPQQQQQPAHLDMFDSQTPSTPAHDSEPPVTTHGEGLPINEKLGHTMSTEQAMPHGAYGAPLTDEPTSLSDSQATPPKSQKFYRRRSMPKRRHSQHPNAELFSIQRQLFHLLLGGLGRFLINLGLVAAVMLVLKEYSKKTALSTIQRRTFNAIITGLSIAIGLNIASALRILARDLRWKGMTTGLMTPKELCLFLTTESVSQVIKLMFTCYKRYFLFIVCFIWVICTVGSQIAVAALGLTYSVDLGPTPLITRTPGNISVTDMTTFTSGVTDGTGDNNTRLERAVAQTYAAVALASYTKSEDDVPDAYSSYNYQPTIYGWDTVPQYPMVDFSPDYTYAIYSNRVATANSTCQAYEVLDGLTGFDEFITYEVDGTNQELFVDFPGPGTTTFIADGSPCPNSRCTNLKVFQSLDPGSDSQISIVFLCNVTLNQITHARYLQQQISDDLATIISGAISVSYLLPDNATVQNSTFVTKFVPKLTQSGDASKMGTFLSMIAVGIIAAADQNNWNTFVSGRGPIAASIITVNWKHIWIVVGLLVGGHFVVVIILTSVSGSVFVPHEDPLTVARLLQPVLNAVDQVNATATEDDDEPQVVFTYTNVNDTEFRTEFLVDGTPSSLFSRFESGWYQKPVTLGRRPSTWVDALKGRS